MKKTGKRYTDNIRESPGHLPASSLKPEKIKISVIDYDPSGARFEELSNIEDSFRFFDNGCVTWINIDGIHDPELISKIGECIGAHPLVLEDIMNPLHRPKFEDHEDYLFIIFKILRFSRDDLGLQQEQVSMILKGNTVITFQEYEGDIFDSVRTRIRLGEGRIRKMKADYLLSCLLDLVVDNYFPILEDMDELIEQTEEGIYSSGRGNTNADLYKIRKQVGFLYSTVWPNRDVVNELRRTENPLIGRKTLLFIKDIHDHTLQVLDLVDSFRENTNGLMELSVAFAGDRLNRIMKFLTLVSTIFIPLSFIAGLYGMNFISMPGLQSRYGFYILCGVMALVAGGMLCFFRKRKWF